MAPRQIVKSQGLALNRASALNRAYYLSHVFSEESDFSLFHYLTLLRLDRAKLHLREGRLNVAEVAAAVGYDNANHFSKLFRRHVGCAPREYAARTGR
jgi:AraC-like DNA-binding protein